MSPEDVGKAGGSAGGQAGGEQAAAGKRIRIVIPVYDQCDLLDVCGPSEIFRWTGSDDTPPFEVVLAARKPGPITFNNGFEINVQTGFAAPIACDATWVPGGEPDALQELMYGADQAFIQFLRGQAAASRFTCSVCEGALLLAKSGLLDGYQATTHWAFVSYLQQYFPKVAIADGYPRFVLDRDRLTGGGISSGIDEALELVRLLGGEALAQSVQQTTQYYPDPPVSSAIPHLSSSPMPPPPRQNAGDT